MGHKTQNVKNVEYLLKLGSKNGLYGPIGGRVASQRMVHWEEEWVYYINRIDLLLC